MPAAQGMVVDGDLVAQARVIFDKMRVTLAAGGLDLGDICRVVRYVTPAALADLPRLDALQAEVFGRRRAGDHHDRRQAACCASEALIEIEAVATAADPGSSISRP